MATKRDSASEEVALTPDIEPTFSLYDEDILFLSSLTRISDKADSL